MTHVPYDWRRTRLQVLRYDMPGRLDYSYNELMEKGVAYGHQCVEARIGENARVIDVRLTAAGDVVILYEP